MLRAAHDLFQFLSPPAAYENRVVALNDVVQQVERKVGKIGRVGRKSTYSPRTKKYFRVRGQLRPGPRPLPSRSLGRGRDQADDLGEHPPSRSEAEGDGEPGRDRHVPETDSNMALIALLQCFGAPYPERRRPHRSRARAPATYSTSCVTSFGAAPKQRGISRGRLRPITMRSSQGDCRWR